MPSFAKFALYAASLVTLTSLSPASLFASASPFPMPFPVMMADYTLEVRHEESFLARSIAISNESDFANPAHSIRALPAANSPESRVHDRADKTKTKPDDQYKSLQAYSKKSKATAAEFKKLAASSASVQDNDYAYQQRCATALSSYQTDYSGFKGLLAELGAEKGLKYYDGNDPLQALLKEIINTHKDILNSVARIVYDLPVLGPILGPIVYELKCILEYTLDFIENVTDGLLNPLKPLLVPTLRALLISTKEASDDGCAEGVLLAGICLLESSSLGSSPLALGL